MKWILSEFRAGDEVEVCSREEILATLDEQGALEGLPFMPEMLQYCGRRYRIAAVAHKACDMIGLPGHGRRLSETVHLAGLRCDGSAHGGCQADCNLFWKDAWLKKVTAGPVVPEGVPTRSAGRCTEEKLYANAIRPSVSEGADYYSCQATQLYVATRPLAWWDVRQYVFDVTSRNRTAQEVCRVLFLAGLRSIVSTLPFGYRVFKKFSDSVHVRLTGRESPSLNPGVLSGLPTPTGSLDLQPGELVRIRPKAQIEQTIDSSGRNRGLTFDCEEMAPYCGRVFKVRKRVSRIIEEPTGKMLHMKQPCIMLDGVVCRSEYVSRRLNCPRAIPSYWRELWLERVDGSREHDRLG